MNEAPHDRELLPAGYAETLEAIKAEVRSARIRVARTANSEMIELYWRLGRLILDRRLEFRDVAERPGGPAKEADELTMVSTARHARQKRLERAIACRR